MATREENLKKINEQLEQLSDEQLEKIAGGYGSDKPSNDGSIDFPPNFPRNIIPNIPHNNPQNLPPDLPIPDPCGDK